MGLSKAERHKKAQKKWYWARVRKGFCVICGKPWSGVTTRCSACLERRRGPDIARARKVYADRVARGVCARCGAPPNESDSGLRECTTCATNDGRRRRTTLGATT